MGTNINREVENHFKLKFCYVFAAVQKTVKASSWTQSLKGIPTAGFIKSIRYGFAKINKMWKSLQKTNGKS